MSTTKRIESVLVGDGSERVRQIVFTLPGNPGERYLIVHETTETGVMNRDPAYFETFGPAQLHFDQLVTDAGGEYVPE